MAELPERLREAAVEHRPDRERMLARVEQAMTASGAGPDNAGDAYAGTRDRPPAPWMRVTAVAAAVAGAIGLGGLAVGAVTGGSTPGQGVVTTAGSNGTPREAGSGTPGTATSRPHSPAGRGTTAPGRQDAGSGHASARATPPGPGAQDGAKATGTAPAGADRGAGAQPPASSGSADGVSTSGAIDASSNAYWTQSDVRLTLTRPLTSLAVELRIAVTPGVSSTGSFDSVPGQTSASVTVEGGFLVYRWQLNPGQTLGPGTYTFAGQFNHAQGDRPTGGDRYTAVGDGPGGSASLSGGY